MPEHNRRELIRRSVVTTLLIAMALTTGTPWLHGGVLQPLLKPVDQQAEANIELTMTRAVYTFAAARAINALVSIIQGTAIAVSPAGVGLTVSIGEVLDPANDLIERFSWIMLVSTVSLGLQRVVMEISNGLVLQWLLTAALLCLALSLWWRTLGAFDIRRSAWRLLMLALLIRFFIPVYAFTSEGIYQDFLSDRYREASQSLDMLQQDLKSTAVVVTRESESSEPRGYLDEMRGLLKDTRDLMNMRQHIDRLKAKLTHLTEYTVTLIVVFSLQTILLPLLMLWMVSRFLRSASRLVWPSAGALPVPSPASRPESGETLKLPEINSQSIYKQDR